MQSFLLLKTEFSTADGEDISISYSNMNLVLEYKDWQEKRVKVTFNEVVAFKFASIEETEIRNDSVYKVIDSEFVKANALLVKESGYKQDEIFHYKLCFNVNQECLDVISAKEFDSKVLG